MTDFLTQVKADVSNDCIVSRTTWLKVLEVAVQAQRDAERYSVLRQHVVPRDISISMRIPPTNIPPDQTIEQRIDMLCDQLTGKGAA